MMLGGWQAPRGSAPLPLYLVIWQFPSCTLSGKPRLSDSSWPTGGLRRLGVVSPWISSWWARSAVTTRELGRTAAFVGVAVLSQGIGVRAEWGEGMLAAGLLHLETHHCPETGGIWPVTREQAVSRSPRTPLSQWPCRTLLSLHGSRGHLGLATVPPSCGVSPAWGAMTPSLPSNSPLPQTDRRDSPPGVPARLVLCWCLCSLEALDPHWFLQNI